MFRHAQYNRFQKFKILSHSERIRTIVEGGIPPPVEWVIYPSNICGYQCSHCIMAKEHTDHRGMLSADAMARVPEDAYKHGIRCVVFSGGGDPLLNPGTKKAAEGLKERGVLTVMNNQGYLLDDPTPFHSIRYSVDAATPEMYQKIHRVPKGDGWERVNANLKKHKDLRDKGVKIEMGLAFLITPTNWKETALFCDWAQLYTYPASVFGF